MKMKRNILLITAAAITALMGNIRAQDVSFEGLSSGMAAMQDGSPGAAVPAPAALPSASTAARHEWLVLVFINGVNDLGILGYADKNINDMEKAGSSDKVAVLAEFGVIGADSATRNLKFQRGSKTLFIRNDADTGAITSPVIYAANDADMGSPAHLVRFAKRGLRRFPAKKVAVIVWNHGLGRRGIGWDNVSGNHMEINQLGGAMSRIKSVLGRKVDVFAMDACAMQTVEVAYELKDSVSVIVGSEDRIPNAGYPYEAILSSLAADPGMSDEALGKIMVDAYGARYQAEKGTLSALRTSALPGFLNLLNDWVQPVISDPEAFKVASWPYDFLVRDSKNLYDYIENVNFFLNYLLPGSRAAVNAGSALKSYIANDLIIRDTALPGTPNAHGLAIYIPDLRYDSANYEKFAFAAESLWDDFLKLMMEERLRQP